MKLYHGSDNGNIKQLTPRLSNHGKPYVYTIVHRALAVMYAHNPFPRPNGFYTYRVLKDGRVFYDEYFENQLEVMYKGVSGYVYTIDVEEEKLKQLDNMPWVYVSETSIDVKHPEFVPDLYEELLRLEKTGEIIINRHKDASEEDKQKWKNIVAREIKDKELKDRLDEPYAKFLHTHFPDLF